MRAVDHRVYTRERLIGQFFPTFRRLKLDSRFPDAGKRSRAPSGISARVAFPRKLYRLYHRDGSGGGGGGSGGGGRDDVSSVYRSLSRRN